MIRLRGGLVTAFILVAVTSRPGWTQAGPARSAGVVFDSVTARPLQHAIVQFTGTSDGIVGRSFVARSDSLGHYLLDNLPAGRYHAGVLHPKLDSLGIENISREVLLHEGTNNIPFAVPSTATLLRRVCRVPTDELKTRSLLFGHVRSARDGAAVPHASVETWWTEPLDSINTGFVRNRTAKVSTRSDGWFAHCAIPTETTVLARAASKSDTSGTVPVRLRGEGVSYVALTIGSGFRVLRQAPRDSNAFDRTSTMWRGAGSLSGTIRDDRGNPVAGADVIVAGTGIVARSGDRGRFSADSLPTGTQLLDIRAIGYEPRQLAVDVVEDGPTIVDMSLTHAVTLERVNVVATLSTKALELLEYRRTRGATAGYFMQPEEIQRRPQDQSMARLIEGLPGVHVICPYPHACEVSMHRPSSHVSRSGREACVPSLYIDGRLDRSGDFNFLDAKHILAVEVYPREVGRPVEFADLHNNCGAVVFWTRRQ
jgi:hypothetical protein